MARLWPLAVPSRGDKTQPSSIRREDCTKPGCTTGVHNRGTKSTQVYRTKWIGSESCRKTLKENLQKLIWLFFGFWYFFLRTYVPLQQDNIAKSSTANSTDIVRLPSAGFSRTNLFPGKTGKNNCVGFWFCESVREFRRNYRSR